MKGGSGGCGSFLKGVNKNMKKLFMCVALVALASGAAFGQQAPSSPKDLLNKMVKANDALKSYKYTWMFEGYDTFTKERRKEMSGHYDNIAKKAGVEDQKVGEEAKLVRAKYDIEFMKPYLSQMTVIKSDLTPKLLWGAVITYRADKDENVWWAKPKISPMAVKRSVKDDDAGGAFASNWSVALLYILYYADNGTLSLSGEKPCEDGTCYVLTVNFDWKKKPAWNHKRPPFDKFKIPSLVADIIWKDLQKVEKQKFSHIDYFVRKKDFTIYKEEQYINEKFHWRNMFANAQLNGLSESDF